MSATVKSRATFADDLAALLTSGIEAANRLETLLQAERKALETEDMADIEQLAPAKLAELQALESLEKDRVAMVSASAPEFGETGIDALVAGDSGHPALSAAWQNYLAAAERCQRANQANGAIIRLRQQQIASILTALSGNRPATYGPAGESRPQQSRALARA